LLQLISLLRVKHTEGVKVLGSADLELHHIFAPLDFHRACILPPSGEEEVFNLMNLLRLHKTPNTLHVNINYQNTIENHRGTSRTMIVKFTILTNHHKLHKTVTTRPYTTRASHKEQRIQKNPKSIQHLAIKFSMLCASVGTLKQRN